MNIYFEQASTLHYETLLKWLEEAHVKEFWDTSQAHRDDILNFIEGRKTPSSYADGLYTYWIGSLDQTPYCLIMTLQEKKDDDLPALKKPYLAPFGNTYSLEYMIGDKNFFAKGLGAKTLTAFLEFFRNTHDPYACMFFIDPDAANPRAKHVYEKAGFTYVSDFVMEGNGMFQGRTTHFLIQKFPPLSTLVPATLKDYPTLQNMARFYVYDLSRHCGFISEDWAIPKDGLYECFDFKPYFEDRTRKAFLLKVAKELAGFVLINQESSFVETQWNMGEFFILAKFQDKGMGRRVAQEIWHLFQGLWEVSVIPENLPALNFWRSTIGSFTKGLYKEDIKTVSYDEHQPNRIIFRFDSTPHLFPKLLDPLKKDHCHALPFHESYYPCR